jgi:hypothetical protein
MFSGFRSLWDMLCTEWQYSTAASMCRTMREASYSHIDIYINEAMVGF